MNIPPSSGRVLGPLPTGLLVYFFIKQRVLSFLYVYLPIPVFCHHLASALLQPHLSTSRQRPQIPEINCIWRGDDWGDDGGDGDRNGNDVVNSERYNIHQRNTTGCMENRKKNLIDVHAENCSFSCGTLYRTQITSPVEQSMKGYWKLENALAGVDVNLPFGQRFEKKNLCEKTWGSIHPHVGGSTPFEDKREISQYVVFWKKK